MDTILHHLVAITKTPTGGFRIAPASQSFVAQYLANHGFNPAAVDTYASLMAQLRLCNASDLEHALSQPAPNSSLRLLWKGLQRAVGLA